MRLPLPPITSIRDFYAFEQHVKTCRKQRGLEMVPEWYKVPVFYFSNHHAVIGHDDTVSAPQGSLALDYELELACVIGKEGVNIPADDRALEHVAGFTIMNDWSARDLQRLEMTVGLGPSKGKDFATSLGPELVTLDELADRYRDGRLHLEMTATVNGKVYSRGNAGSMFWTWPQLIAHASRDVRVVPGEVLGSGTVGTGCILELTPEAVGGWLKPGDIVELTIERLGTLRNPVVNKLDYS
jgi:fumarylacetoacetate (FAA) hydrolase